VRQLAEHDQAARLAAEGVAVCEETGRVLCREDVEWDPEHPELYLR